MNGVRVRLHSKELIRRPSTQGLTTIILPFAIFSIITVVLLTVRLRNHRPRSDYESRMTQKKVNHPRMDISSSSVAANVTRDVISIQEVNNLLQHLKPVTLSRRKWMTLVRRLRRLQRHNLPTAEILILNLYRGQCWRGQNTHYGCSTGHSSTERLPLSSHSSKHWIGRRFIFKLPNSFKLIISLEDLGTCGPQTCYVILVDVKFFSAISVSL